MVEFTDTELEYIKKEMHKFVDVWNNGTKEEIKDLVECITGEQLDSVLLMSQKCFMFYTEKNINQEQYYNKKIIDFCWEALGMWAFNESNIQTSEELKQIIDDEVYCNLYEKILNNL